MSVTERIKGGHTPKNNNPKSVTTPHLLYAAKPGEVG